MKHILLTTIAAVFTEEVGSFGFIVKDGHI